MMNFLHKMYNRIKELKKYHAMHAFTAVPGCLVILAYTVTFLINVIDGYTQDGSQLFIFSFFIAYYFIFCACLIIAICICILFLLLSIFKKKKFFVNSLFLLNNKYYNFVFFTGLIINIFATILFTALWLNLCSGFYFNLIETLNFPLAVIFGLFNIISTQFQHLIDILKNIL